MKLNLGLIMENLKTPYERVAGYTDGALGLIGICPYVAGQQYAKDILYLAQWPQLRDEPRIPENVILIGGGDSALAFLEKHQINGLIFSGDCTLPGIMLEVQNIFFKYDEKEHALLNALLMNKPIQNILNACAAIMNCHASLYGSDYMLLGYSDVNLPPDSNALWQETLVANRCQIPMNTQKRDRDKAFQSKSEAGPRSVFLNTVGSENTHISSAFYHDDLHVATLVFSSDSGALSARHLWLADYIVETIHKSIIERFSSYLNPHDYLRISLITALRYAVVSDSRALKINMSRIGWRMNDDYRILLIKLPSDSCNLSHSLHAYENVFADAYPNYVTFWYDDYIFVLLRNDACNELEKYLSVLKKQLTQSNGSCSVGMKFCDLNQLRLHYELAAMPHKIHIFAKQRIKFYRDILETHIVNIITSRFPLRAVCHTAAIRLQEHDIANGTNYLETLEIYLLNNRSLLAASNKLFLHRSTLAYRIKCIQNITQVQFEDPDERLHLLLSCLALRIMSRNSLTDVDYPGANPQDAHYDFILEIREHTKGSKPRKTEAAKPPVPGQESK
ncbi:MAG TPA: PucR family transcriptional regulator [Papillibacter sp.]|nr:PucR family transcriptional regulator [Papillibacter sp.]